MAEEDIPEAIRAWHPFYIAYPDYTPQDDFTSWLSGYEARVQSTFGFNADETDKIHDEVVRSIPESWRLALPWTPTTAWTTMSKWITIALSRD